LYSYRVRARIELLDGDIPAAVRTLLRLEEFGHREGLDRLVAWSLHDQIVIAIRTHEHVSLHELVARLERCADRYRLRHDCVWSEISLASLLARAEVAFAETGDASCVPFIDAADEASAANGRQLLSTRLGFMRAIALLRENNADSLPQAIRLTRVACDLGMKRVLLDFGASARNLMAALGPAQMEARERAYLDGIAALIDAPAAAPVPASVARRAETPDSQVLSSREREVLELLSKALSTKSIARALDLSSGTVKWHLKNIYAKLDALSREDALNKARALKILA
jgi:LuxR family maltose regulon positive regulatory protein